MSDKGMKKIGKTMNHQIELCEKEIQHLVIEKEYQEAAVRQQYIEACKTVLEIIDSEII